MLEVRPIDANALLEKVKSTICVLCFNNSGTTIIRGIKKDDVIRIIEKEATLDYEPVVYCKDCKYLLKTKMLCLHKENRVFNTGLIVHNNHYCSYGAKMDEEVNKNDSISEISM